jgi:hypothetical protein
MRVDNVTNVECIARAANDGIHETYMLTCGRTKGSTPLHHEILLCPLSGGINVRGGLGWKILEDDQSLIRPSIKTGNLTSGSKSHWKCPEGKLDL